MVLILGLEVLLNHIGLTKEDTMGSSVGSSDGIIYEKKHVDSLLESLLSKSPDVEAIGIRIWSMNMGGRQRTFLI